MGANTNIEWCNHSWSPWRGCTKVSPGCANCYAEKLSKRNPAVLGQWGKGAPRVLAKNWGDPVRWNKEVEGKLRCAGCGRIGNAETWRYDILKKNPRALACCPDNARKPYRPTVFPSLCDWLDEEVYAKWLANFLALTNLTPNLDWLLLTKRPELWRQQIDAAALASTEYHQKWIVEWLRGNPPQNVCIGTSVEDQQRFDERIPELLKIPAKVRFLSVEPLIGPISFDHYGHSKLKGVCTSCVPFNCELHGSSELLQRAPCNQRIHWVIVGGESGPRARACNVEWIRSIMKQCATAKVPCFVKQLGSHPIAPQNTFWDEARFQGATHQHNNVILTHPKGGDPEEWPDDLRVRQFPEAKP